MLLIGWIAWALFHDGFFIIEMLVEVLMFQGCGRRSYYGQSYEYYQKVTILFIDKHHILDVP